MRYRRYDSMTKPFVIDTGHRFDGSGDSSLTYRHPQIYPTNDGGYTTASGHPVEDIGWFYNPAIDATYKRFRDTVTGDLGHSYNESDAATIVGKAPTPKEQADSYVRNYGLEQLVRDAGYLPNDNTWLAGYGREQNPHLEYRGLAGARKHAAWEREHPYLSTAGYVASAAPFAVASYPLMAAAGEMAYPYLFAGNPYVDTFFTALGGADALNAISHGRANAMTALEMTPMFRAAKPMYNAAKEVPNALYTLYDNGTVWDKYTTLGGRFGNYSDYPFVNVYATAARRWGLPDKPRIPADAFRKVKTDVGEIVPVNNGFIDLTGGIRLGKGHTNFSLDRGVTDHNSGGWSLADTYASPTQKILDHAANTPSSLKSIESSDMFLDGSERLTVEPHKVTLISGDKAALIKAKNAGMQTLSSHRLRRMFEEKQAEYERHMAQYKKEIADKSGFVRRMAKEPTAPKHIRYYQPYADEVNRLITQRGTPTLQDFRLLEQQTGLNAGVAPISEYQNAIDNANEIFKNGTGEYTFPNGYQVINKNNALYQIGLMQKAKYNNVFYSPASPVESRWRKNPW